MSKILISGCGMSWSKQEKPTWVNVLKICGADIDDRSGPAISNQLILNSMIEAIMEGEYSQAVCQLTATGKLDVELTNPQREKVKEADSTRNFKHGDYWPSSFSQDHLSKKLYYEYLHSPTIEQSDIIYKWMLLKRLCEDRNVKLHTILGYKIQWHQRYNHRLIETDHNWHIQEDYMNSEYYSLHDHTTKDNNPVPNKYYMVCLAKRLNTMYLNLPINDRLEKFRG
jgi:hypothetical protein